jgi:hypothetical protein
MNWYQQIFLCMYNDQCFFLLLLFRFLLTNTISMVLNLFVRSQRVNVQHIDLQTWYVQYRHSSRQTWSFVVVRIQFVTIEQSHREDTIETEDWKRFFDEHIRIVYDNENIMDRSMISHCFINRLRQTVTSTCSIIDIVDISSIVMSFSWLSHYILPSTMIVYIRLIFFVPMLPFSIQVYL